MERQAIENRLLANILAVTSTMTIGKTKAARIVGGRGKLERLHRSGKVTCQDKVNAQNGKWRYNLSEILMHCRATQVKQKETTQVKQQTQKS